MWRGLWWRCFAAAFIRAMELTTILNRCHRFRGFVYWHARFGPGKKSIEIDVRPNKGSTASTIYSGGGSILCACVGRGTQ